MKRDQAIRALETLAASPAATWIGNRIVDGGALLQKCMRCGAEQLLGLPSGVVPAFQGGSRGDAIASLVPSDFDEKLFAWKVNFQHAHARCIEDGVS